VDRKSRVEKLFTIPLDKSIINITGFTLNLEEPVT
jgi:hypothetical protein